MPLAAALAWLAEAGRGDGALPGEAGLADLARTARALAVAMPGDHQAAASCHRGCSACCHQAAPVSPAEAFLLARLLDRDDRLRRRAAAWRRRARRLGIECASTGFAIAMRQRLPCPALGHDGACTIHPDRPLICREHLVESDPARCADPAGVGVRPLPVPLALAEALSLASARLLDAAPVSIPLAIVRGWARAHRVWDARRWSRSTLVAALADALPKRPDRRG